MDLHQPSKIRITCSLGLGKALREEVEALGYTPIRESETDLEIEGNLDDAMRLNLELRVGFHVQLELDRFTCPDADTLYGAVNALAWEELLPLESYFSVVSRVSNSTITNSMFPSLKVKDAVVDRISAQLGARPDSGPMRDRIVLTLLWLGNDAVMYLDTSGEKLSDRGYRRVMSKAPMRETLAAALVKATGYDGSGPFVNPMCGSGTLAIEAALIATNRAPGLLRSNFSFKHLKGFDEPAWQALRHKIKQTSRASAAPICATDIDPKAVEAARKNATTAGVDHLIHFEVCDFEETPIPEDAGIVLLNPPYGKRLGENDELAKLYPRIGDFFKQHCQGYTGYVFTGNMDQAKRVGLRTKRRMPFFNGEVECRLLKYELYRGSVKKNKNPPADG